MKRQKIKTLFWRHVYSSSLHRMKLLFYMFCIFKLLILLLLWNVRKRSFIEIMSFLQFCNTHTHSEKSIGCQWWLTNMNILSVTNKSAYRKKKTNRKHIMAPKAKCKMANVQTQLETLNEMMMDGENHQREAAVKLKTWRNDSSRGNTFQEVSNNKIKYCSK